MASTFAAMSSVGSLITPSGSVLDKIHVSSSTKLSSFASISSCPFGQRKSVVVRKTRPLVTAAAKELYFNKDGSAIKKLQVHLSKTVL